MVTNTVCQASCTGTFLRYMCHPFGIPFLHLFVSEKCEVTWGPFSGIDCSHFILFISDLCPHPMNQKREGGMEKTINWFGECNLWDWHFNNNNNKQTPKWRESNLLKSFEVTLARNLNGAKCFQVTPEIVLHVKDEHKHWSKTWQPT